VFFQRVKSRGSYRLPDCDTWQLPRLTVLRRTVISTQLSASWMCSYLCVPRSACECVRLTVFSEFYTRQTFPPIFSYGVCRGILLLLIVKIVSSCWDLFLKVPCVTVRAWRACVTVCFSFQFIIIFKFNYTLYEFLEYLFRFNYGNYNIQI